MTMTDFTGTQLATILSALDGRTRNPASKAAALAAIRRHANAFGCSLEDILETAAGLLDSQISADAFRAQLRDKAAAESAERPEEGAGPDTGRTDGDSSAAAKAAPEANSDNREPSVVCREAERPQLSPTVEWAPTVKQQLLTACKRAAEVLHEDEIEEDTLQMLRAAIARAEGQTRRATTEVSARPPRSDSKQARLIAMLQRGASINDMTREFGWLRHTCHGALAGLKKKRGLNIISNKPADGERIYRLNAPAEGSGHAA
jgi:Protein of unknown function (DUF3489)